MSAKELKDQTIGDAKFWLGLAAFMLTLMTVIWKGGENSAKLDEVVTKLNKLEPVIERVAGLESTVKNLEQRMNRMEFHPADNNNYFHRDPKQP